MYDISKRDWKLFREKLPAWQERYMGQLIKGYIELLNSDGNPSERFWELEKRIKKDRKHPGVIVEMKKSEAIYTLIHLYRDHAITDDDLEGFSQELIDAIRKLSSWD